MAELAVRELKKYFGDGPSRVTALDDISFDVSGSVFVSIVGPSGCGKSTLLNVLSGVLPPSSGTISAQNDHGADAVIGYVFQEARLLPWRTVMQNLMFVQKGPANTARERCERFLRLVHLGDKSALFPGQLSGGMQQRVGIARAFAAQPDLLVMDEPFSHLDAITARSLRRELYTLWKETQVTVLFVTHDVGEAVELSNRVIILGPGGHVVDDLAIDLPFPRDTTDDQVALTKAGILRRFEELDLLAAT